MPILNPSRTDVEKLIEARQKHAPGVFTFGSTNVLAVWNDRTETWTAYLGISGPVPFVQTTGNLSDLAFALATRGIKA